MLRRRLPYLTYLTCRPFGGSDLVAGCHVGAVPKAGGGGACRRSCEGRGRPRRLLHIISSKVPCSSSTRTPWMGATVRMHAWRGAACAGHLHSSRLAASRSGGAQTAVVIMWYSLDSRSGAATPQQALQCSEHSRRCWGAYIRLTRRPHTLRRGSAAGPYTGSTGMTRVAAPGMQGAVSADDIPPRE